MYLIDDTFFTREFAIPNTDEPDSSALNELNQFIDERCRLLLRYALGYSEFSEFDSFVIDGKLPDVPTDPDTEDPVPVKWRRLVDGYSYTIDGQQYDWGGLLQTIGSFKSSALVSYVYYYWLENNVSYVSGVGEVKANAKNAGNVNSTQRLNNTWNEFVRMYQGGCYGIPVGNVYHVGIPQYEGYYVGQFGTQREASLLQYLSQNADVYVDCELRRYDTKNQLGL